MEMDPIAKIALEDIRPATVASLDDGELLQTWHRLNQWFFRARELGNEVEIFVNAGLWIMDELEKRGVEITPSLYTQAIEELRSGWSTMLEARLKSLPSEIMLAENFVSVVGSVAKGKALPRDIDVLMRADVADGKLSLAAQNVWMPIKDTLDPDKRDRVHCIANAQGPHASSIALYDLVLRAKQGLAKQRENAAEMNWSRHWVDMLPSSGKGRFAYQHHWRGLSQEETGLGERALFETNHSLHGDLRLEGDRELWGWTVFLGPAAENTPDDKLVRGEDVRTTPKLAQPIEWLDVGAAAQGDVMEPGEPGATNRTAAKFFEQDKGTYQLGVVTEHAVEIFLDGDELKGRYFITYPEIAGERLWLLSRPQDQTPRAETANLEEMIADQRSKGRRAVVWARPGEKPQVYRISKSDPIHIAKADASRHIVYGIVLDPYTDDGPAEDAHNDWMPPCEVQDTAHRYLRDSRRLGLQHSKPANAAVVESWIEQYPSEEDYQRAMRGEAHTIYRRPFGDDVIHSGAWAMGVSLGPDEWRLYENGEINAFSPGGVGVRTPMARSEMPQVRVLDMTTEAKDGR